MVALLLTLLATPAVTDERAEPGAEHTGGELQLQLGAGAYDAVRRDDIAGHLAFQVALRPRRYDIRPVIGLFVTSDEALYGYVGAARDFELTPRFLFTPQFAFGIYENGDGKELGHAVEFLSSLQFSYRFAGGSRLGLAYQHISNGGIAETNPGAEIVLLTWTWRTGQ